MSAERRVAAAHSEVEQPPVEKAAERKLETLQPNVRKTPEEMVEDVSRRYPVTMARLAE